MTQHAPLVTRALIVIEVKEKKQQADFRLVRRGEKRSFPHTSFTAHYQMELPNSTLEGRAWLSLAL